MITFLDDYHNIHTKIVPLLWLATSPMTNLLATLVVRCPIYQNAAGQNSWQYTHAWRVTSKHHQRADTISMSSILLSPSLQYDQDSFYLHHQCKKVAFIQTRNAKSVFDSHSHGTNGAFLVMAPADPAWGLLSWFNIPHSLDTVTCYIPQVRC